jgi:hypothetical protein
MASLHSEVHARIVASMEAELRKKSATRRAVESRVRRKLAQEGELLRKTRPGKTWAKHDCGDYYVVDVAMNGVVATHCDLEDLAHELGVLAKGVEITN